MFSPWGWLLLHAAVAAVLTLLARRYSVGRQLLDQPGERRSHRVATPRGGGISIVLVTLFAAAVLALRWPDHSQMLACFAVGLLLVAGAGWLDDHRPVSPWWRLAAHAVAGSTLGVGVLLGGHGLVAAGAALVLVMVLVNVWNFMDGIDGLASTQALLATGGMGLLLAPGPWSWLAFGAAAAILGFLPFNFPRARIFLGDVGSGALGFILASLVLVAGLRRPADGVLALLPLAAFLVDSGLTLAARIIRGEQWWKPHVEHAYQRWSRQWKSHARITLAYAIFSLGAGLSMLWAIGWHLMGVIWVCSVWFGLAAFAWTTQQRTST